MNDKEEKEVWIGFANASIQSYDVPEGIDNMEALVDDIADFSGMVADAMLKEFKERFDDRPRRRRDREEPEEPEKD
jgi:hypothetical protein